MRGGRCSSVEGYRVLPLEPADDGVNYCRYSSLCIFEEANAQPVVPTFGSSAGEVER